MELTEEQFKAIEPHLPRQRGNVKIDNRTMLNALLHIMYEGCTWRGLPARFGAWHTIYTRWMRWSKKGVWYEVFRALQETGVLPSEATYGGLDSTSVKVHKHGLGAKKSTVGRRSDAAAAG